ILAMAGFAALAVVAHRLLPEQVPTVEGAPFTLIGIALSIFLAFRNNASYERWWEARKLWGQLIHLCRTFARQTLLLSGDEHSRPYLLRLIMAFVHALVPLLRGTSDHVAARQFLSVDDAQRIERGNWHPSLVLRLVSEELVRQRVEKGLSDIDFQTLDTTIDQMEAALAGCERIRNTPLPFAYTLLLHRTAYLFCVLLPFGYADVLGWWTPFVVGLIAYTFFGLDALGEELEDPFGKEPNDLPIVALAMTIELNMRASLGETDLPPAPQPKDFLLL
ncbi:bestrophin family protein, partial [Devosia sp.]|uniref:bestrophin family protein n=1 Tax=Devosia sp. TaxID=1871048 RepID=UPI001ACC3276